MIWRVVYGLGFCFGPMFLWVMRWRFGSGARPLEANERELLSHYFDDAVLKGVRVRALGAIRLPLSGLFARVGIHLAQPIGLALGKLIVVRSDLSAGERASVVFHEMVHVRQHAELGAARFSGAYASGW